MWDCTASRALLPLGSVLGTMAGRSDLPEDHSAGVLAMPLVTGARSSPSPWNGDEAQSLSGCSRKRASIWERGWRCVLTLKRWI